MAIFWIYMTQLERNTKNLMTHLMLLKVIKYNNIFLNLKPDTPKYLRLFMAELIIEFFVIAVVIIANIRKKRRKYLENCS